MMRTARFKKVCKELSARKDDCALRGHPTPGEMLIVDCLGLLAEIGIEILERMPSPKPQSFPESAPPPEVR